MEGICPFAIWRPGPKWKAGYTVFGRTSEKHGVVDHSSGGPLAATLGELDSWKTKSWQFTNDDSGLYQHYPISDVCWHAGFKANKAYVGVESTGKDDPLTLRQYDHLLELHLWLKERGVLTVCELRTDLWEHGWLMPTDCPSGRIPWSRLISDLKEEPMEIQDDFAELRAIEMAEMSGPETAHQLLRYEQMRTLSAIRHSKHESTGEEMECWKELSSAYDAEVAAIREAQKRCRVHGRPG